jgi:Tol biopolymer transport system component
MGGQNRSGSWSELAALLDILLDTAPDRRRALIAEMSGDDPVRLAELERLLDECEREPALLIRSAPDIFGQLFDEDVVQFPAALAGRYEMQKELGHGGMATVYLAIDRKHRREVAVKVLHQRLTSALRADRFLREIEIVAQLQHPHIVPLYDSGEADGSLYYVMPYEAGLSLRERVVSDGGLPLEDVVLILRDVCDALGHAHSRGIVHRDIKPDNVLLSGRHAMVADFGVAKAATDAAAGPASAIAFGTPAYMAPEQIEASPDVDHRADIYAVGVLAYELLAGAPPFSGDSRADIAARHLHEMPVPLATLRPGIPDSLAGLVMKCLAKRPEHRWQSVGDMAQRLDSIALEVGGANKRDPRRRRIRGLLVGTALVLAAIALAVVASKRNIAFDAWQKRWASARIERLTDFPGSEVDAAISADGKRVAFLSDRDSVFDAFVTTVGSDEFLNLTGGRFHQLLNEGVQNVGFAGDPSRVWIRVADFAAGASVFLVPATGGAPNLFLPTAVMAAWSPDGKKLAYHETTPGDPIFVADSGGANPKRIFISDPGIHNHYLAWSPDGRFIYFTRGSPPDRMDIWRVASGGGEIERVTTDNSRLSHPVLLDASTLVYTATADDGTGPWLYLMDVNEREARRVTKGVEHYISIAASAELPGTPRRLVAAVSNPSVQLWTVPIGQSVSDEGRAHPIPLPTARSAAPRFGGARTVWYLASRSGADGLWRVTNGEAAEIWKADRGAVVGGAAVSPDGRRVCFPVRYQRRTSLYCASSDGTGARVLAASLDVRGSASWSPDGKWIAVGVDQGQGPRLFKIPVDGGLPVRLVDSASSNPVWAPDGRFILYSGTPRARSAPLKAVTSDGRPFTVPSVLVDRDGDSYRFVPGTSTIVVKQGGFRSQDFWLLDLSSGAQRRLTRLRQGESLQRFDVSPDGSRIVFERVRENSDIALIELPSR